MFARIKKYRQIIKEKGVRGFIKTVGWKVVAFIFIYYLVRDVTLYILIPYLIAKGIFS